MFPPAGFYRINIRRMGPADIPGAMRLSEQAGWNQLAADWQRMLALEPEGSFVAETDGAVVGTTICVTFGPVAWLAMVLVDAPFRGRGLGRRLVQAGLDFADAAGARSVRLDATPLGQPLYESLGFAWQFGLQRWSGTANAKGDDPPDDGASSLYEDEIVRKRVLALDRAATATDRKRWLAALLAESRPDVIINKRGSVAGWLTTRPGRLGTYIGPCCGSPRVASELFNRALRRHHGERVIADLRYGSALTATAARGGLKPERVLQRMCRGVGVVENLHRFQLSSGPELG